MLQMPPKPQSTSPGKPMFPPHWDNFATITTLIPSRFSGDADAFLEASQQSTTYSAHTFSPVEVQFNESRTKGIAFSTGSVTIRLAYDGVEYDVVSWLRFVSKVQKLEDVGWRLLSLEAIYDRDSLIPTSPIAGSSLPPVIDTTSSRASYKYLTWALTLRGYNVSQDLPGTDDEKRMKKCLDAAYGWLNGGT